MLIGQNVRDVIKCSSCKKPRAIYCKRVLTNREIKEVKRIKTFDYVCGALITPDVSFLAGEVFTRLQLTCRSPIKWAYYSYPKARKDSCCYCSRSGIVDQETKKSFKTVLPMCDNCKTNNKKVLARGPLASKRKNEDKNKKVVPKKKK